MRLDLGMIRKCTLLHCSEELSFEHATKTDKYWAYLRTKASCTKDVLRTGTLVTPRQQSSTNARSHDGRARRGEISFCPTIHHQGRHKLRQSEVASAPIVMTGSSRASKDEALQFPLQCLLFAALVPCRHCYTTAARHGSTTKLHT